MIRPCLSTLWSHRDVRGTCSDRSVGTWLFLHRVEWWCHPAVVSRSSVKGWGTQELLLSPRLGWGYAWRVECQARVSCIATEPFYAGLLCFTTNSSLSNSGLIPLSSGCWVNAAAISFYFCFLLSLLWSTICPFVWCVQKSNSISISLLRSPGRHNWAIVQRCSWPCWWEWTMCWMFNGNWVMDEWLDQIKVK